MYVLMEYYSAIKKNEIVSFTGKWMELEIMFSEVMQVQKDKGHLPHGAWVFIHTVSRSWLEGEGRLPLPQLCAYGQVT
jgi:hypothetical protein